MTNNNTMSKGYYLFEHIFWGILTLIWFNNILFRNIEGLTYDQSRHFLWCTIILSLTVGAAITWKKRRNNLSLFVNVIIPYELSMVKKSITPFHRSLVRGAERIRASTILWISM